MKVSKKWSEISSTLYKSTLYWAKPDEDSDIQTEDPGVLNEP